ncbi:electron transfer flavoprotein subunit beta [Marinomonas mediterranea]|uniref:electron transfer flavoprotein subunit beta n=1 Tax=Marinomonas mediterranea TaxID=119864 RepID=UPI002349BF60|nr:electron transfer flavoprotein subunit beta [Marinomonas mediterranea]WCN08992.1 electron transfer flavoprotein subunit beta [Marinomonas mediterranea]WCN13026.1 electron transfer flavoprotein subunit beta [Marinomonas mediterranea]
MQPNVISLVSIGRHPQSGRARRSEQDARALELGLKLSGTNLRVAHAGNPEDAVLRQYAGMGLKEMTVLKQSIEVDVIPSLRHYIESQSAQIALLGVRSESGESSGMVPYILAESLGWPIVSRVADIVSVENGIAEVLLALPRGQRRAVSVRLPFIATVDNAAPAPRQTAYGPAQRAKIDVIDVPEVQDELRVNWSEAPAKPRPKRLKVVKAKTAAERFKAATAKAQGGSGKVMSDESAEEKAQAIFDLLIEEKVIR